MEQQSSAHVAVAFDGIDPPDIAYIRDIGLIGLGVAVVVLAIRRLRQAVINQDQADYDLRIEVAQLRLEITRLNESCHAMDVAYRVCEAQREAQSRTLEAQGVQLMEIKKELDNLKRAI